MMHAGSSTARIIERISNVFRSPSPSAIDTIRNTAAAEVQAGRSMAAMPLAEAFPAIHGHLQPHLFGDDTGGDRTLTGVTLTDAFGNPLITINIRDNGSRSLAEQIHEAVDAAKDIISRYPGKFAGTSPDDVDTLDAIPIYSARRF
jgi:hypothetical protein